MEREPSQSRAFVGVLFLLQSLSLSGWDTCFFCSLCPCQGEILITPCVFLLGDVVSPVVKEFENRIQAQTWNERFSKSIFPLFLAGAATWCFDVASRSYITPKLRFFVPLLFPFKYFWYALPPKRKRVWRKPFCHPPHSRICCYDISGWPVLPALLMYGRGLFIVEHQLHIIQMVDKMKQPSHPVGIYRGVRFKAI